MYRKARSAVCIFLLTSLLLLAACNDNSSKASTPTAQQLISKAQDAIKRVKSYHFTLTTDNPGTSNSSTLSIRAADGDIQVPDRLKALASALALGFAVKVNIIAIGDKQYYTDPITGKWATTANLLDPRTLADPQSGVAAILGHIQNPSKPTDGSVAGTACWSIDGKLDTQYLAGITGGSTQAGTTVDTTTCIGKSDNLPYQIRIKGIALQGDTTKTIRTFTLSKFNEPLNILAPSV